MLVALNVGHNMNFLLRYLLLASLLSCSIFGSEEQVLRPMVIRDPCDTRLFSWLHRGALFYVVFERGGEGVYIYRTHSGHPITVTGSISGLSEMIRQELKDEESAKRIALDQLPYLLSDMLGPKDSLVLDEGYSRSFDTTTLAHTALLKYPKKADITFDANHRWKLCFYVTPGNGSIERWDADGSLLPFSIDQLKRATVEKNGTLPQLAGGWIK